MTDTIERKALALVNEARSLCRTSILSDKMARDLANELERAIERHEQFAQEVSDAVEYHWPLSKAPPYFARFIIAKPDPLVEAMIECGFGDSSNAADDIRAALAARGLEITEKKP